MKMYWPTLIVCLIIYLFYPVKSICVKIVMKYFGIKVASEIICFTFAGK